MQIKPGKCNGPDVVVCFVSEPPSPLDGASLLSRHLRRTRRSREHLAVFFPGRRNHGRRSDSREPLLPPLSRNASCEIPDIAVRHHKVRVRELG